MSKKINLEKEITSKFENSEIVTKILEYVKDQSFSVDECSSMLMDIFGADCGVNFDSISKELMKCQFEKVELFT